MVHMNSIASGVKRRVSSPRQSFRGLNSSQGFRCSFYLLSEMHPPSHSGFRRYISKTIAHIFVFIEYSFKISSVPRDLSLLFLSFPHSLLPFMLSSLFFTLGFCFLMYTETYIRWYLSPSFHGLLCDRAINPAAKATVGVESQERSNDQNYKATTDDVPPDVANREYKTPFTHSRYATGNGVYAWFSFAQRLH